MRSDVVIVGYRLNAKEPAAKALERILGLAAEEARALARTFPAVVARAVPQERAEQLADALRTAGAQVDLRDAGEAEARAPRASTAAQPALPPVRSIPLPVSAARPPSAVAPTEASGSYMLGDFGFEGARGPAAHATAPGSASVAPAAPAAPARAPREDIAFDLALGGGGLSLELDDGSAAPAPIELGGSSPPANDHHQLAERFDDLAPPSAVPQVEERAFRAVQQRARPDEARRSRPPPNRAERLRRVLAGTVGAWLPSLTLLAVLCTGSALAVGYALDPSDVVGALRRELAAPAFSAGADAFAVSSEPTGSDLHPLLRAAPSGVRAPLASILRARIAGVHQLALSFDAGGVRADCMLLEPELQHDAARMASLRETGHQVEPPPAISAQLREQARALNAGARGQVALKPLCLAL